ncbi:hypothetical protein BCR39DRAFT_548028 [Naematelia encephala]|uniref:Nucleoporin Pom152 n=1 Tax=Naematelia encephala TaxID=71784 RepID=A0A1Y2ANL3_9TREE|nr:hypothetical protein BCR39DRAFT_548028 [Naematelia encephala]
MASPSTPANKLGTPIRSSAPGVQYPQAPPPVIPTTWLQPYEQRWLFASVFGLLEVIKVWDILAPYVTDPEPTWSSHVRVRDAWTTLGWMLFELGTISLISTLRIPMISPSWGQLGMIALALIGWNLACWFVAEPGAFFMSIHLVGPAALGGEWYWAWWYAMKRSWQPKHIGGVHKIRLLPYSTATLNPLSVTYCIPPDNPVPLYIPIIFNNSIPEEVSYYIRSLETGHTDTKTILGVSMRKPAVKKPRLSITNEDEDEEDTTEPEIDPLSALVLHKEPNLDVAKLPSVKPSDSLALVPQKLEPTQDMLFISIDKPSVVSLKQVTDRHGDRFHITPHREAVIIECPTGGHFVDRDHEGKHTKKHDTPQPAEIRCVGDEEVVTFEARGVGTLKAAWKKQSKDATTHGIIEGIEEDFQDNDELALVHRDRISRTHTVPLRLAHDQPGVYTVALTSITDSMHNTYIPSGHSAEKVFNVLPRANAAFNSPEPRELLANRTSAIPFSVQGFNGPGSVEIIYQHASPEGEITTGSMRLSRKDDAIPVDSPGTYSLLEIKSVCSGMIREPSSVQVRLVPPPKVDIQVTTLHECAMDVGVTVDFDFAGTPPFTVFYTEQRKGTRMDSKSATFRSHHGDLKLLPNYEGEYTYTFIALSDAKYQQVSLDKPPIKQTVHPLANVELFGNPRRTLFACSGDEIEIDFEAKGAKPLHLTYLKSWSGQAENITSPIAPGKQKLHVPVPPSLSAESGASGRLTIELMAIEDGNGCARRLSSKPIEVDINRQKPTVRFSNSEKVTVTEGDLVRAPLRLTGQAPWDLWYSLDNKAEKKITVRDANAQLSFEDKGAYRLTKVKDAHCAGTVHDVASTFEVNFKPRPTVHVQTSELVRLDGSTYRHAGLCAGEEDQVALRFEGQAPYELGYRYTTKDRTYKDVLKSASSNGVLHLAFEPGSHRYDLLDLKDSNYARTPVSMVIEHEVYRRPSASFTKINTQPVCLDSPLSGDARIKLTGKAPFSLLMAVRKPASSHHAQYQVEVPGHEWTLDLPLLLSDVGRHEVSIVSVSDASGCAHIVHESDRLNTIVEVVESARIVPVDNVQDLCVGDNLDFLLQGKAPWTIEYEWLGSKFKVTSSASRFSRYAEVEGEFKVKSVALKDNQCKREISDLVRRVHPLPSVKIQEGIDSLREGQLWFSPLFPFLSHQRKKSVPDVKIIGDDPAAFSVHFTGTPPYSFTYTRSESASARGRSRVVDTQTVTDVWEDRYTISSSSPGDYEVVSVSDKWCRYPPLRRTEV